MSAAFDYRTHYREVRQRLNRAPLTVIPAEQAPTTAYVEAPVRDVLWLASDRPKPSFLVAREIVAEVCEKFDVNFMEICSMRRNMRVVRARQEICYRLRKETPWSYPQIGKYLGDRDHTTIIHGMKAHAARNGLPL